MQFQPFFKTVCHTAFLFAFTTAVSTSVTSVWAQSNNPRVDSVLLEMNQAFKKSDKTRLTALLPQATSSGHPLEAWAAYWELKARLEDAPAFEVQNFMARYAGTYQEDRMRNDWLLLLGKNRGVTRFAAEYPKFRMNDDKEVRCYAILVDLLNAASPKLTNLSGADMAQEVRKNWHGQRDADDGCNAAAQQLIRDRVAGFDAADAWKKARLSMEANRPSAARNALVFIAPNASNSIAEIQNNAFSYLRKRTNLGTAEQKETAVLALIRLATSNADGAATMLETLASQLTPEQRYWAWGAIGKQAATSLNSQAATYFSHTNFNNDKGLPDDTLGWKVRALLRVTARPNWQAIQDSIAAMSEVAQKEPIWVYWKARALKAQGAQPQANALFESIASVRGFYEQLALEELGRKITVPERPAPLTAQEKETARQNPGLQRALLAIAIGFTPRGVREWNYSTNLTNSSGQAGGMGDRELLAAAQLACEREVWDRCINTSDRTKSVIDFEQRFPTPFRNSVVRRAGDINLDPAYVYGLIRQESRFIMDARSGVGASGLMQVMPATARWTANKIGLTGFTPDQINDRETNIAIGTGYLKLVLDDFGGSMPLAAAAYNAGPGRPRSWRNGPHLETAVWAENIPFAETRDYVKKVLSNTTNYAALLTGQAQSLKNRLGTVGPREGGDARVNTDLP